MELREKIQIEESLNRIKFKNVPVGSLLAYKIHSVYYRKNKLRAAEVLRSWMWVVKKLSLRRKTLKLKAYCLILSSDDPRYHKMLGPVRKQFDESEVSYIYIKNLISTFFIIDFLKVLPSILFFVLRNINFLKSNLKGLSFTTRFFFYSHLVTQLLKSEMVANQLKRNKNIQHILVDWDRQSSQSIIIATAKSLGIKTTTAIHGSTAPPVLYLPLLADFCLGWGNMHRDLFLEYGISLDRLIISGSTSFDKIIKLENVKEKYDVNVSKITTLFISQNYYDKRQFAIFESILKAAKSNDAIQVVLKPHPADNMTIMQKFKETLEADFVMLPKSCSLPEAISMADVVIVMGSTVLIDAMISGKRLAVFNPGNTTEEIGNIAHKKGGVLCINNEAELSELFERIKSENMDSVFNTKNVDTEYICKKYGDAAARHMAQHLRGIKTID